MVRTLIRSLSVLLLLASVSLTAGCTYSKEEPPVLGGGEKPPTGDVIKPPMGDIGTGGVKPCIPTTCSATGKNCGEIDDKCGKKMSCGDCTAPATCEGGGVANVCADPGKPCSETDTDFCGRYGKTCGSYSANDNCGTPKTATCGTCTGSMTCVANVCVTPPDTTPPSILSTTPSNSAIGIEPSVVTIKVTFSEPVQTDSLTMTLSGADVTTAFNPEVTEATFTLKTGTRLSLLTKYTATITAGLKDTAGNQLGTDYTWTFTTRDGKWGVASEIGDPTATTSATEPNVSIGAGGKGVAVWQQGVAGATDIYARSHDGEVWVKGTSATKISTLALGDYASDPKVVVDKDGAAAVVWQQWIAAISRYGVLPNRYDNKDGKWGTATPISGSASADRINPQIGINRPGNTIGVVWNNSDPAPNGKIDSMLFRPKISAGYTISDASSTAAPAQYAQVAIDKDGHSLFVWAGKVGELYARRYLYDLAKTSWSAAGGTWVQLNKTGTCSNPQVGVDDTGRFLVVWQQTEPSGVSSIYARRFDGSKWDDDPVKLSASGDSSGPQLAVNKSGHVVVVWQQVNDVVVPTPYTYAARYNGTVWSSPTKLIPSTDGSSDARVVLDETGNALAVWRECNTSSPPPRFCLLASRLAAGGSTWEAASYIDKDTPGSKFSPQPSLDAHGRITVVWQLRDSASKGHIYARRFE